MAIKPDQEATLTQGQFRTLHKTIMRPCRVTLTGISGEFATIPFRIRSGRFEGETFEASEASIPGGRGLAPKSIQATTPEGVGTLDIVYELRTGSDA
jgi:hypothetical protein